MKVTTVREENWDQPLAERSLSSRKSINIFNSWMLVRGLFSFKKNCWSVIILSRRWMMERRWLVQQQSWCWWPAPEPVWTHLLFFGWYLGRADFFPLSGPYGSSSIPPHLSGSGVFIQSLQELPESWTSSKHTVIRHMRAQALWHAGQRHTPSWVIHCRTFHMPTGEYRLKDWITKTLGPAKLFPGHSLQTWGSTFPWSNPRVMIRVGEGWDWVAGCPCLLWKRKPLGLLWSILLWWIPAHFFYRFEIHTVECVCVCVQLAEGRMWKVSCLDFITALTKLN